MTDEERIAIERRILTKFVEDVYRDGRNLITVDDGEGESMPFGSVQAVVAACMSTDDDKLYVYHCPEPSGEYKLIGYVHFVYGNEGWDVIGDHSVNGRFDELVKGANDLSDQIAEERGGR